MQRHFIFYIPGVQRRGWLKQQNVGLRVRDGPVFELPNHGSSRGFHVHRVSANRWEFVRTEEGWKISRRTLRPLDGTAPARDILKRALEPTGAD